jgi:hypothetical protein
VLLASLLPVACMAGCAEPAQDDQWWDVGEPIDPELDYAEHGDKDGDEDDDGSEVESQIFWGDLELDGLDALGGVVGFYWTTPEDGVRCEVHYVLSDLDSIAPCEACVAAWTLTLGPANVTMGDACAEQGFDGQEGAFYNVGYGGSFAWKQGGDDWYGNGTAEVEGQTLFFEFDLLAGR